MAEDFQKNKLRLLKIMESLKDLFKKLKQATCDSKFKWFLLGIVFILSLDLSVKYWAENVLIEEIPLEQVFSHKELNNIRVLLPDRNSYLFKDIEIIKPYFVFSYVRNLDIGFSLLRFTDKWLSEKTKALFVRSLQLTAIITIFLYFLYHQYAYFYPSILIIGGGLGNVTDRFYRGYVVDYVRLEWPGSPFAIFKPWPVFNLADSFVLIGGVILLLIIFLEDMKKKVDE